MIDINIEKIITNNKLNKYEKLSKILYYLFIELANISSNKYYILGSFAIRKHREISDLDINLDHNSFFKLDIVIKKGFGNLEIYNGQIRWFFDMTNEYNKLTNNNTNDFSIEAFQKNPDEGFPNPNFSLNSLINNNGLDIDENGHQFFNLKTLLEWKITMNRPKDQTDIILINDILKKQNAKRGSKRNSKVNAKRNSKVNAKRGSKKSSRAKNKK